MKISFGSKSGGSKDAVMVERITTATMTPTARRTARKSLRDTSSTIRMQSSFCRAGFMAAGMGMALIWRTTSFIKDPLFLWLSDYISPSAGRGSRCNGTPIPNPAAHRSISSRVSGGIRNRGDVSRWTSRDRFRRHRSTRIRFRVCRARPGSP